MKNLKIFRPTKEDVEPLNDFFKMMIQHTFDSNGIFGMEDLIKEEIVEKRRLLDLDFATEGEKVHFLMAKVEEVIVGTIAYCPSDGLIHQCTNGRLSHCPEIGTAFIHPKYQRRGLGSLLFARIIQVLQEQGVKEVCWDSGYPMAQQIWTRKFGNPQYELKDYWGEGATHMIWHLSVEVVQKHLEQA